MVTEKFQQGDKVQWSTGQGTTTGTVQRRVTQSLEVDGHAVTASQEDPRYLVKNDSTGKVTGHKPETLSQAKSDADDTKGDTLTDQNRDKILAFEQAVNMTPNEIENWLATDESQSVGQKDESGHIKGRQSGKHIIAILNKNKADYAEDDIQHMGKVVSYIHRHTAQRPSGDVTDTRWRYSLMNWGHDPLKNY